MYPFRHDTAFLCISRVSLISILSLSLSFLSNPAYIANVNANALAVLRIRLIHARRCASLQSASLTQPYLDEFTSYRTSYPVDGQRS